MPMKKSKAKLESKSTEESGKLSLEEKRLKNPGKDFVSQWQKWGPYVAERAWGTVREDYSPNGDAWSYFPYEQSYTKVYRWGDDGIAGWCDRYQVLLFAPAFWNGRDPFLKERLYGLNSHEGNHGEDVKESYYYLDGIPTHSYMKYLYKYPQEEFPYQKLKSENQNRSTSDPEYELIDTGVFDQQRYFDIFIEYAKASPEDICIKIEAFNRGDQGAPLHIIPHLWFRNQWAWGDKRLPEPKIENGSKKGSPICLIADEDQMSSLSNLSFDYRLGKRYLYGPEEGTALFTDNETRFSNETKRDCYYKDGFHRKIIHNEPSVSPAHEGTKACIHYYFPDVPSHRSAVIYLRLSDKPLSNPLEDVEKVISSKKKEADHFYARIHPPKASIEEKAIQRQAFAGMLWNKQIYLFDVNLWFKGDNPNFPPTESRLRIRNVHWRHLNSMRILSMPDKWEYPWFAAWDHAFHCMTLGLIDIDFAKEQLWLLLFDQFQHPNGQIPAYEWEFSDINPPVQGWAALRLYNMERKKRGKGDRDFLQRCFHKLLINFAWWVNKVDSSGNNVFEGGFLGMDNISLLDRSQRMVGGIKLQQSDGTGWMALFCLNLMRMAIELAKQDRAYESLATKFFEHYIYIADAMKKRGNQQYEMWSDKDRFFYDVLTYPDGKFAKFRVRSMVGIIPLYALELLEEDELASLPDFRRDFFWFLNNRKNLVSQCVIPVKKQTKTHYVLSLMSEEQIQSVLAYVWDPEEFRSTYGLRSLSKYHLKYPFVFQNKKIGYEPAESLERIKGGNSNWRGPIWMPANFMLIDALKHLAKTCREEFKTAVEGEQEVDVDQMATSFANRLISLFTKDETGHRPFRGPEFPFKQDPHWKDHLEFFEYYNPETGKGMGASHQTGWSALVANLIDEFRR
jgi:hypothetical protein